MEKEEVAAMESECFVPATDFEIVITSHLRKCRHERENRSLSKLITATKLKVVVLLLLNRWICSCCSRMDDSQQHECREQTMDHYRGVHFLVKELNALKVLEANIPILELNIPTFGGKDIPVLFADILSILVVKFLGVLMKLF
ncbi:hypothetical protein K1719_038912 [Acacia pycnantha]|nr:hypothetical protein K1719_038912 [Acacia pycnantha]